MLDNIEVKHLHVDTAGYSYYLVNNKLLNFRFRMYQDGSFEIFEVKYSEFDYDPNNNTVELAPYCIDSFYINDKDLQFLEFFGSNHRISDGEYAKFVKEYGDYEMNISGSTKTKFINNTIDYNIWLTKDNKTSYEKLMYPIVYGFANGYLINKSVKLKRKYKLKYIL